MQLNSYRTLGRSGLRVSPLGFGALTFDDGSWGSGPEESFDMLDRYHAAGGNFIDTANTYKGGLSEETIGAYFQQRPGRRDRMIVATKFSGTIYPDEPNGGGAGRKTICAQLDESLRRLDTDYVDLYWMHQWDRHTPPVDVFPARRPRQNRQRTLDIRRLGRAGMGAAATAGNVHSDRGPHVKPA